jgi:hypothetical protein
MHRGILFALATMAVCLSMTTVVQAAPLISTQAFADIGIPTAGGSSTGNINTATSFTIGSLTSTPANTGLFVGMPTQTFISNIPFSLTSPTSLSFGNAVFGSFTSTSIVEATNIPGSIAIYALGNWTPGTYGTAAKPVGPSRPASPSLSTRPPRVTAPSQTPPPSRSSRLRRLVCLSRPAS